MVWRAGLMRMEVSDGSQRGSPAGKRPPAKCKCPYQNTGTCSLNFLCSSPSIFVERLLHDRHVDTDSRLLTVRSGKTDAYIITWHNFRSAVQNLLAPVRKEAGRDVSVAEGARRRADLYSPPSSNVRQVDIYRGTM